jgi:ubiquinone/menaquinone biosynthesis C-methylase UbiE
MTGDSSTAAATQRSNYRKYQTGNPIVRRLFDGFFARLKQIMREQKPTSVLDVGCGEGEAIARLLEVLPEDVVGVDVNEDSLAFAGHRHPRFRFEVRSVYQLPYPDRAFDVVMCLEVLEHLERPDDALRELLRVTGRALVLSVPHEPYFRIGSLLRGKYLASLGNHPEHIQHWNPKSFQAFLSAMGVEAGIQRAFPWIIAVCRLPQQEKA